MGNDCGFDKRIADAMIDAWRARFVKSPYMDTASVYDWRMAIFPGMHLGTGWGFRDPDRAITRVVSVLLHDLHQAKALVMCVAPRLSRRALHPDGGDYYAPSDMIATMRAISPPGYVWREWVSR